MMFQFLLGLFAILHGLVHLWFVVLSQGWVNIKPGMAEIGWTGRSWLFTGLLGDATTRLLAGFLFTIAAIAFVISGVGVFTRAEWSWTALVTSALFSCTVILLLWDGALKLLLEKGLIGFLLSLVLFLALLIFKRTYFAL